MKYYENTKADFKAVSAKLAEKLFNVATERKGLKVGETIKIDGKNYTLDYVSISSYNAYFGTRGISIYYRHGNSVIRISDHWSDSGDVFKRSNKLNCLWIASCYWRLLNVTKESAVEVFSPNCGKYGYRVIGGKCMLKNFQEHEKRGE